MSSPLRPPEDALQEGVLAALLGARLPRPEHYWVAYSGGLDSTVLLHLLAAVRGRLPAPLAAIHVDHGLQADSARWAEDCRRRCDALGVALQIAPVDARPGSGESPEAAARRARYAAIAAHVGPGAMLLTAHHLDDQAETLLLQLLRGAGVEGLAAMPLVREWRGGWHARPLLGVARSALRAWAEERRLRWVEDPSNAQTQADRNYLRHRLMPLLRARWPAAAQRIANSALHCAEAAELVAGQAERALDGALSEDRRRLRVEALRMLPETLARQVLRRWLRGRAAAPLPQPRLTEALDQICRAGADAQLRIAWQGGELRRFRGEVWYLAQAPGTAPERALDWHGEELRLGPGLGRLRRRLAAGGIDPARWEAGRVQVGFRHADLRCRPAGRQGTRAFKKLAQEYAIPPWLRPITPILLIDQRPAAVANCCVCDPFAAPPDQPGWVIDWTPEGSD